MASTVFALYVALWSPAFYVIVDAKRTAIKLLISRVFGKQEEINWRISFPTVNSINDCGCLFGFITFSDVYQAWMSIWVYYNQKRFQALNNENKFSYFRLLLKIFFYDWNLKIYKIWKLLITVARKIILIRELHLSASSLFWKTCVESSMIFVLFGIFECFLVFFFSVDQDCVCLS